MKITLDFLRNKANEYKESMNGLSENDNEYNYYLGAYNAITDLID